MINTPFRTKLFKTDVEQKFCLVTSVSNAKFTVQISFDDNDEFIFYFFPREF